MKSRSFKYDNGHGDDNDNDDDDDDGDDDDYDNVKKDDDNDDNDYDDDSDENTWRGMAEPPFIDMWKSFGGGLCDFRGLYTSDQNPFSFSWWLLCHTDHDS